MSVNTNIIELSSDADEEKSSSRTNFTTNIYSAMLLAYERVHLSQQFAEFSKKVEAGLSNHIDTVANAN